MVKLYKYSSINNKLLNSLKESYIYFSNPSNFNDPFDCSFKSYFINKKNGYINYLEEIIYDNELNINFSSDDLVEYLDNYLKRNPLSENILKMNLYGIACFTKMRDNILLWSHYANSHTGICLEYEFNNDNSFSIKHQIQDELEFDEYYDLNHKGFTLINVDYHRKNLIPKYTVDKDESKSIDALRVFSTKSYDWKYEQEVRAINLQAGAFQIPKKWLTGIIYGCRTKEKDIQKINKTVLEYNYDIKLYRAVEDTKQYSLNIISF